jgi:hypothetical protein
MPRAIVIGGIVLLAIAFATAAHRSGKSKTDSRFKPWYPSK